MGRRGGERRYDAGVIARSPRGFGVVLGKRSTASSRRTPPVCAFFFAVQIQPDGPVLAHFNASCLVRDTCRKNVVLLPSECIFRLLYSIIRTRPVSI